MMQNGHISEVPDDPACSRSMLLLSSGTLSGSSGHCPDRPDGRPNDPGKLCICNDQTSKDLSLCDYRASPRIDSVGHTV